MTVIEQIKAEIERQIKKYRDEGFGCHANSLERLLNFLNTLESEKPIEGLEEEISRYIDDERNKPTHEYGWNVDDIQKCARHFAKWGADHLKK